MDAVGPGQWRAVAEHLTLVADSLDGAGSAFSDSSQLVSKARLGGLDGPPHLQFRSEADRAAWHELVSTGADELEVAYAGARALEPHLRALPHAVADAERTIPAAMLEEMSRAVGYAERMNSARGRWVESARRLAVEPDTTHGIRSRPSVRLEHASIHQYQGMGVGLQRSVDSVRTLAKVADDLARPAEPSTAASLHLERGGQLAMGDALTAMPGTVATEGIDVALHERELATPVVREILESGTPAATALSTATREDLLATAARRLDDAARGGTFAAGPTLAAIRDIAGLASQSRELVDDLAPALERAERSVAASVTTPMPAKPTMLEGGLDMWGVQPMGRATGAGADVSGEVARLRSVIDDAAGAAPVLGREIRAELPPAAGPDAQRRFADAGG
ncbi:MAG: hypothetical protein JWM98_2251, partial [Thermoleophilia bacterium]|nr:hypothetical protein [Thermoleophilia bacterium]